MLQRRAASTSPPPRGGKEVAHHPQLILSSADHGRSARTMVTVPVGAEEFSRRCRLRSAMRFTYRHGKQRPIAEKKMRERSPSNTSATQSRQVFISQHPPELEPQQTSFAMDAPHPVRPTHNGTPRATLAQTTRPNPGPVSSPMSEPWVKPRMPKTRRVMSDAMQQNPMGGAMTNTITAGHWLVSLLYRSHPLE